MATREFPSCVKCGKKFPGKVLNDNLVDIYCYPCWNKKNPEKVVKSTYPTYEKEHSISARNLEAWK